MKITKIIVSNSFALSRKEKEKSVSELREKEKIIEIKRRRRIW